MKKISLIGTAITGLVCLGGCSLFHQHHEPATPRPMKTHFERLPENTVEPRFNEVSPTTDY